MSTSSQPPVGAIPKGDDERDDAPFAPPSSDGDAINTSNVRPFDPMLNASSKLTSLSDEAIAGLCTRARTYFFSHASGASLERAICVEEEGLNGANSMECNLLVDECLATTLFEYVECSLNGVTRSGAECDATVSMYAGCETEWASLAKAYAEYFTCDLADPTVTKAIPQQLKSSLVRCDSLYAACPDLGS